MNESAEILIIGAGASGLMAARELAKQGKKVTILESRDRIGGRIMPLDEEEFGYPAQGGAEFVHGNAPITKALMKEAGLTFIPEEGEIWSTRNGKFAQHAQFIQGNTFLQETLGKITEDMSIKAFLDTYLPGDEHADLRNSITKMIEGYEAADPTRVSTLKLRNEWFGKQYGDDGRIREGYGALLNYLKDECIKNGVQIYLNSPVRSVTHTSGEVTVETVAQTIFKAKKVIVTVPLPTLQHIHFIPELPQKIDLASKIGFGGAIKLIIKFKDQWWKKGEKEDLRQMAFLLCNEEFMAWWSQYPAETTVLTGWLAGPAAQKNKGLSDNELFDLGISTLAHNFGVEKNVLEKEVVAWKVINWISDPYTLGAYSYTTLDTFDACEKLCEPIDNTIFFAGEALYSGAETATVEGALGSGKEVSNKILAIEK